MDRPVIDLAGASGADRAFAVALVSSRSNPSCREV
jgi:hypothetical protein